MILISELKPVGSVLKPHGLRGEMVVELDDPAVATGGLRHVVLRVDGIFVPFRIASQRSRGAGAVLLTLDGVESAEAAAEYAGHDVYALRRELPETDANAGEDDGEGLYAEDLCGFTLTLPDGTAVGRITDVDTSTANTLLSVERDDEDSPLLIPLAEDWIEDLDAERRIISMDIPDALLSGL